MEILKCGCRVEKGKFILCEGCAHCKECNAVAKLHPFGNLRLHDLNA